MKHKRVLPLVLVFSLLVGTVSNLIHPVLAEMDSGIEISTETLNSDDIVVEFSDDVIVVQGSKENVNNLNPDEDIKYDVVNDDVSFDIEMDVDTEDVIVTDSDTLDDDVTVDTIDDDVTVDTIDEDVTVDTIDEDVTVDTIDDDVTVDTIDEDVTVDTIDDDVTVDTLDDDVTIDTIDDVVATEQEIGVDAIDDTENVVMDSSDIDISEDTDDVDVFENPLYASVLQSEDDVVLNTGTSSVLTVNATNHSDKSAVFKLYFCAMSDDVSDDTVDLTPYLTNPAKLVQVEDLDENYSLPVVLTDIDGNTQDTVISFLKEMKDDELISRYGMLDLPAGMSTEFTIKVTSEKNDTVMLIPVLEQETSVIGENVTVAWGKKLSFFDKFVQFFFGDEDEEESVADIDVETSDMQGIELDITGVDDVNFSSMRLVVVTNDESIITDKIIGAYDNIYLLQFDSVQETKNAYIKYKDRVDAVEPDNSVEVASSVSLDGVTSMVVPDDMDADVVSDDEQNLDVLSEVDIVSESATTDDLSKDVPTVLDETTEETTTEETTTEETTTEETTTEETTTVNPFDALQLTDSEFVQTEQNIIAVIDTGVNEHPNVIDRISVIDNLPVSTNTHGDAMVSAITSQNPDANILSIRAMDDNGFGTISSLVAAMEYAIQYDVDSINLSLSARTTLTTSVLKHVIQKAIANGITVIGAAGNDGVDVKDYVPGSIEEAYIIGSATTDGFRQVLSNYGATVDYNVVATSTSEAAALFTGYVSRYGIDSVSTVLNQGLIYETHYQSDTDTDTDTVINTTQDVDFSMYTPVTDKQFFVKYTFVDAKRLTDEITFDNLFTSDNIDLVYGNFLAEATLYDVGDGTYQAKANAPLVNGYATSDYLMAEFARGNNYADMVTEGVSLDLHTGIVTMDKTVFDYERKDTDFCDLQVQVLIPVSDIPERVVQDVTVVQSDGTEYDFKFAAYGLQIASVPLSIEGIERELTAEDFELYINNNTEPVSNTTWDNENHVLYASGVYTAGVHAMKVVIKADVDSVFKVADFVHAGGNGLVGPDRKHNYYSEGVYQNIDAMFYLRQGTNVADWNIGKWDVKWSYIGDGTEVWGQTPPSHTLGSNSIFYDRLDGNAANIAAYIGIPSNLFGVDFWFHSDNGTPDLSWTNQTGNYSTINNVVDYNAGVGSYCHHIGANVMGHDDGEDIYYEIIDKKRDDTEKTTYFAMIMMSMEGYNQVQPTKHQSIGGVVVFGVKDDEIKFADFSVEKVWKESDGDEITDAATLKNLGNVTVKLVCDNTGKVYDADDKLNANGKRDGNVQLNQDNGWTHTWTDVPVLQDGVYYTYHIEEKQVAKYEISYDGEDGAFSGDETNGFKAIVTNTEIDDPKDGYLYVVKASKLPDITNNNKCYSLENAEFGVYSERNCDDDSKVGNNLKTNANGVTAKMKVAPGTYWIKEEVAPKGFKRSNKKIKVVVTSNHDTEAKAAFGTLENEPFNDPVVIRIRKEPDPDDVANFPADKIAPLSGAQFTIKYYDTIAEQTAAQLKQMTPTRTWVIETKKVGNYYQALLNDNYLVAGSSDAVYKNANGSVVVPLGTITIEETKAPLGYKLEGTFVDLKGNTFGAGELYIARILDGGGGVNLDGNQVGSEKLTMIEEVTPLKITVKKYQPDGRTPLAGAEFTLTDSANRVVATKTTNAQGKVVFENLYRDTFTITETKTVAGYQLLKEPIVATLPMRITAAQKVALGIADDKCTMIDANTYEVNELTYEVTNHATFDMPMSGGAFSRKLFLPLGIGMAILISSFALVFRKRKAFFEDNE